MENQTRVQVTGKQLERFFLMIIGTLLGFVIVKLAIIPEITFLQFFFTELTVMIVAGIGFRLSK